MGQIILIDIFLPLVELGVQTFCSFYAFFTCNNNRCSSFIINKIVYFSAILSEKTICDIITEFVPCNFNFTGTASNATVVNAYDYYPFGMMMPGRKFADNSAYRYGFNGKENDNDVKGVEGSQQDYGFRIYDPRIGKFLSVDPISIDYPELTAYQFASNRPIEGVDLDGLELGLARLLYSRNTSTKVNKTEERKVITMSSTKSNSCHGVGNPNFVMSTYLPKGEPWFKKFNKLVGIGEGNNEGIRNGGGSRITSEDALGQNGPKATNPDPEAIKLDMLVISRLGQLESNPGLAPKDMLDWMIIAKDFTENQMGAKKAGPGATQYLADEVIPVVQEFFSKEQNSETPKYCTDCQITYIISGNDTTGVLPKTAESEKIKGKVDTIDVKSEQHPKVLKFKTSE